MCAYVVGVKPMHTADVVCQPRKRHRTIRIVCLNEGRMWERERGEYSNTQIPPPVLLIIHWRFAHCKCVEHEYMYSRPFFELFIQFWCIAFCVLRRVLLLTFLSFLIFLSACFFFGTKLASMFHEKSAAVTVAATDPRRDKTAIKQCHSNAVSSSTMPSPILTEEKFML